MEKLELNYENFIDFCILLGCDYCNGLNDIHPNIIFKYFKETKNIDATLQLLRNNGFRVESDLRNENIGYDTRKNNDTSSNFTVEFYKNFILD